MPRPDGYVSPGSKKELGSEQQQDKALWGLAHGGMYRALSNRRRARGISRDNWHKRRKTGGKKQKYELGRPAANTKIGPRRIHTVRVRGGNKKYRALRLDVGNFSWGSECCTRKTRIIDVVYNASNNELVRTKTLVKNCIVLVDSTPCGQWYESHYALPLGRKKGAKLTPEEEEILNKKRSKKIQKKYDERKKNAKISSLLEEQSSLQCLATTILLNVSDFDHSE
ncbi:PREDICTED: 40S ribosomal protein S8-like [Myotis brandtii]|uniref:40S ribosomal protein S8-like n=1 Tax=Myotis brandtii TaxID=109478 RepID=UPI00070416A4|nr:PREDICTED: 40S ribosomal protein S8-like [Myotis brandtii]